MSFVAKPCSGFLCSGITGVILADDGSSIFLDTVYMSNLFKKGIVTMICGMVENSNPKTDREPPFVSL